MDLLVFFWGATITVLICWFFGFLNPLCLLSITAAVYVVFKSR